MPKSLDITIPDLTGSLALVTGASDGIGFEIAARLARSGVDLAVLGLGPNGHLGFNEPPSGRDAPTRVVELAPESIRSNARYWGSEDDVPRRAVTAGMSVLMAARTVILVVAGASKRAILREVLEGPVTERVPASFLQRHPRAVVLADRAALDG